MIAITDTAPDVRVHLAEYQRLLGYPRSRVLDGRALELADQARAWYAEHGRPWVHAREVDRVDVADGVVRIDGVPFASPRLERTLRAAGADRVVLVAVSAGPELEARAQELWREEKPDEYFFHEVYGSAVVEHLVMATGARLCAIAEPNGLAVLPHDSPGYPDWDIAEQAGVHGLLARDGALPGPIDVLDSGMLRPKKSLLAVFGMTRHVERVRPLSDLVPCESCSLARCQYRRAPYGRSRRRTEVEAMMLDEETQMPESPPPPIAPLDLAATYSINGKALRRWVGERLTIEPQDDGTTRALFRYEGTTCSNTGRALHFRYAVTLGTRDARYPILDQRCEPATGDDGYTFMCRYRSAAADLMASIDDERPLHGQPLDDVLSWPRPAMAAACYCERESRKHKWGIVLETIHYAIAQQEKQRREAP